MRRTTSGESSTSPPSAELYSLALESPAQRRPFPKSAGSASLPAAPVALARSTSWESGGDDKHRGRSGTQKSLGLTRLQVDEPPASPFADPLRSPSASTTGHRTSIVSSTTNETRSLPPTPDCNYARRRNSARSTSSLSHSPTSPAGMYVPSTSRQRYSIASSSYAHTIGDLSTSSMPLLRHPTRGGGGGGGDDASSYHATDTASAAGGASGAGSAGGWTGSRVHLADFSRTSYYSDDASSVHSYPPKPRQRTGSTWTTSENGEVSRHSWTRDFELTGATGQVQRRGSADSRNDSWPAFVSNSYVHQPIARPTPAYLSQLSTYSFPPAPTGPSASSSSKVAPPRPVAASPGPSSRGGAFGRSNPLAPLRKRLARSLAGAGGHLHTEVQLLLELVDALDHCITLFCTPDPTFPPPGSRSSPPPSPTIPVPCDDSTTMTTPSTASATRNIMHSKIVVLDEVRLLVRELVELVPDAQRCLANGQYGPLALPNTTTSRLVESLERRPERRARDSSRDDESSSSSSVVSASPPSPSAAPPRKTATGALGPLPPMTTATTTTTTRAALLSDAWPSRLARDCRSLLVEAGLPTGRGATVWLAARLSEEGIDDDDAAPGFARSPPPSSGTRRGPGGGARGPHEVESGGSPDPLVLLERTSDPVHHDHHHHHHHGGVEASADDSDSDVVELREALTTTGPPPPPGPPPRVGRPRSAEVESARRDELLEQGKKRWEAYRRKQMQRGPS